MATKRSAADVVVANNARSTLSTPAGDLVEIIPLGAGQEVGRSCVILKYQGKTIMFDCGIHPGLSGMASLPFFDEVDLETVDAILITHFHLDHCAALPYVVGHTRFEGRVFMTHPTKAITASLLRDFVRVSRGGVAPTTNNQNANASSSGGGGSAGAGQSLYTEAHLDAAMEKTELLDFHSTVDLGGGVRVTAHRAGHVLGAAMFMVEVAGLRVLYTGDYSRLADRHLPAADLPSPPPHVLIVEATYGVSRHVPRLEREARFLAKVREILARGGRVLLPVVALGRAQELLLILEEHWAANPRLAAAVPIYQASGLARRAMGVYQTYIEMMNDAIKRAFAAGNPFVFRHVRHLRSPSELDDCGACVVLATPSMLQSGLSRDLFDAWCEDPRNGVVIADFAVAGTLAREILSAPETVVSRSGQRLHLRCSVDAISFSAHADFDQTAQFVDALSPPDVVLVHGEATEMLRLKRALEARAAAAAAAAAGGDGGGDGDDKSKARRHHLRRVFAPKVGQPVHVRHAASHVARVVGSLAGGGVGGVDAKRQVPPPRPGQPVRGLLVAPLTEAARAAAAAGAAEAAAAGAGAGAGGAGGGGAPSSSVISAASMAAPPIIVAPADLPSYTRLRVGRVRQRQAVPLPVISSTSTTSTTKKGDAEAGSSSKSKGGGGSKKVYASFSDVRLALEVLFEGAGGARDLGGVEALVPSAGDGGETEKDGGGGDEKKAAATTTATATKGAPSSSSSSSQKITTLRIGRLVTLTHDPSVTPPSVLLSWEGGPLADAVADAVVAAVLSASPTPPADVAEAAAAREREASSPEKDGEEDDKAGPRKKRLARIAEADARLLAAVLASQFGTAKVVSPPSSSTLMSAAAAAAEVKDEKVDDAAADADALLLRPSSSPSSAAAFSAAAASSFVVEVESDGVRVSVDAATGELVASASEAEEEEEEEEVEAKAKAKAKAEGGGEKAKRPRVAEGGGGGGVPSSAARAAALGSRVVAAAKRLRAALDPLPLDV